ncbi:MAG: hypothetical protein J5879_08495 [Clostridia bacterium]|nr:hypothetical protein [Clostridia bacterium]
MKKIVCAVILISMLLPLCAHGADAGYGFYLCAESGSNAMALNKSDVVAAQFVAVKPFTAVGFNCPSYGNDKGALTLSLFVFDQSYDNSLSKAPIAEHEFVDFKDNANVEFEFDTPLPAGEYLLCAYNAHDETGDPGVGVWYNSAHESQRMYKNGAYNSINSLSLHIVYTEKPEDKPYGIPSAPVFTGENAAPFKAAVFDFSDISPEMLARCGSSTSDASCELKDGLLSVTLSKSIDPWVLLNMTDLGITVAEYPVAAFCFRLGDGCPNKGGQLFFATDSYRSFAEAGSFKYSYKKTDDFQKLIIDISSNANAGGTLTSLRWDIFTETDEKAHIDVKYIAFFSSYEAAEAFDGDFSKFRDDGTGEYVKPDKDTFKTGQSEYYSNKLTEYTYTMDFTKTALDYSKEGNYGFTSIKNASVRDSALYCKAFSSFSVYSEQMTGDVYAVADNTFSYKAKIEKGYINTGLFLIANSDTVSKSGIWFKIDGNELTVSVADGQKTSIPFEPEGERKYEFITKRDGERSTLELKADGAAICTVALQYDDGRVSYAVSSDGAELISGKTEKISYAGYMHTEVDRLSGYIDDMTYTHTDVEYISHDGKAADTSNWVSYDALGRSVTQEKTKKDKYVGIFYFMNHSEDMDSRTMYDATDIYLTQGLDGLKKTLSGMAGRNGVTWAEPYFGYYCSDDVWVFRRHASMLYNAGIDFIFIDLSNAKYYTNQVIKLLDTWCDMRAHGQGTPGVCFMYGDMPATFTKGVYEQLDKIYKNEKYADILFRWDGKILILGNDDGATNASKWTVSATTPQTKKDYKTIIAADEALAEFAKKDLKSALENFTVRKCWAWQAGKYNGYWDWLQDSPQDKGTDKNGNFEQMAVAMGIHAHTSRGRSFINGKDGYDTGEDFGFSLGTAKYGYLFAEQFEYALAQDPQVIMITGWNEWYAGVNPGSADQKTGSTPTPGYYLVDQFTPEYSRDGEPMRLADGVGFGDNYYYQMVEYIRRFKGSGEPLTAAGQINAETGEPIIADENFVYSDTVNDTTFRSERSFAGKFRYIENSGRNDITGASVICDENYVYITAATAADTVKYDGDLFMQLFIDTDRKQETGWEGYDLLVSGYGEKVGVYALDGKGEKTEKAKVDYTLDGRYLTVKLPAALLGSVKDGFDFKWADNSDALQRGIMRFLDKGDAAPDGRFNYRYDFTGYAGVVTVQTEPATDSETAETTDIQTQNGNSNTWIIFVIAGAVTVAAVVVVIVVIKKKK